MLSKCIRFLERLDYRLQRLKTHQVDQTPTVSIDQINGDTLDFASPCFVLSTGRCGTKWLTKLLGLSDKVWANHSDYPELIRHSRLAYEQYEQEPRVFYEVIRATRDGFIIEAYKRGQVYLETNNRITFFAYAIRQAYPKAKFIHIVRHPGDFVRSGLSRNWYHGHPHDVGRIVRPGPAEVWQAMGDIERIAWLWNETNRYVEDFLARLPQQDYIQVKAEDMFSNVSVSMDLCRFIGVDDITPRAIAKMLTNRVNRQRKWVIGPYRTWSEDQKEQVRQQATLAVRYEYEL